MNTLEGNKLIAEFMGIPKCDRCIGDCGQYKFGNSIYYRVDELFYHTSWDWLMPVVEKIGNIHYGWMELENEFQDTAFPFTFGMRDAEGNYMFRFNASQLHTAPTLIEATWSAVIDFITWYNTTKKVNQ